MCKFNSLLSIPHSANSFEALRWQKRKMKATETPAKQNSGGGETTHKPYFRPAKDDSKPLLQDPVRITLSLSTTFLIRVFVWCSLSLSRYWDPTPFTPRKPSCACLLSQIPSNSNPCPIEFFLIVTRIYFSTFQNLNSAQFCHQSLPLQCAMY